MAQVEQNERYWLEYSNLQKVKHDIIREYLKGWLPKIGQLDGAEDLLYVDTHAGRGRHLGGQLGSPLVALEAIAGHKALDIVLRRRRVLMLFVERDDSNMDALARELGAFGELPNRVKVGRRCANGFRVLSNAAAHFETKPRSFHPAFFFVDPFGFKIPGDVLRRLMKHKGVEVFVNLMWREVNMAIAQGPDSTLAPRLDSVFGSQDWRSLLEVEGHDERASAAADLYRVTTGAKWSTHIRMLQDNGKTRYLLIHLTNSRAGRDLMKDVVWQVCPDGGFYAKKSEDHRQELLVTPSFDPRPLDDWVLRQLATGPTRWSELLERLRSELWLQKHLNKALKRLRKEGRVRATAEGAQFTMKADPELALAEVDPDSL